MRRGAGGELLGGAGAHIIMGMNHGWQRLLGVGFAAVLLIASRGLAQVEYELGPEGFEAVSRPVETGPAGELQVARTALAEGNASRAESLSSSWLDKYPYHPLRAQALLLHGDAQVAQGNYYKSLFDYEAVCREFPGSGAFALALERELEVARIYSSGTKRRFLGFRFLEAEGEAAELYIRIQERAPGGKLAETAAIELGDHYYARGEMWLSSEMYDIFLENYPRSLWSSYAMQRLSESHLARFKGPRFDATGLLEAERTLTAYQKAHPTEAERAGAKELIERIDEQLAEKDLNAAQWYEKQQKLVSAKFMYRRVVEAYPRSAAARRAAARLGQLGETVALGGERGDGGPTRQVIDDAEPTIRRSDVIDGQPRESFDLPGQRRDTGLPVTVPTPTERE